MATKIDVLAKKKKADIAEKKSKHANHQSEEDRI